MIDGRVSARAEERVRGLRVARQSVGPAGRCSAATGPRASTCRWCARLPTWRGSTVSSTSARRCRSIRAARRSRAPSCKHPAAGRRPLRHARAARRIDRRVRAPGRQRGAVPAAGERPRGHARRARRHAHRHLRPARAELAAQRVSRARRLDCEVLHHTQLIAELLADGRIHIEASCERIDLSRPVLPRPSQRRVRCAARDPGSVSASTRRSSSRCRARRRCAAAPAAAACGWRRRSASESISLRVEQALDASPQTIATACPYCAVMIGGRLGRAAVGRRDTVARHRRARRRRAVGGPCRRPACAGRRRRGSPGPDAVGSSRPTARRATDSVEKRRLDRVRRRSPRARCSDKPSEIAPVEPRTGADSGHVPAAP